MAGIRLRPSTTKPSLVDREWQERADRLQFIALADVRAAAERWTKTIGSVTGIFGVITVVQGPKEVEELRWFLFVVVGVLLLVSVLAALASILFGAMAAQGTPQTILTTARQLHDLEQKQTADAARRLRLSRLLALGAVLPLIVAVALTWYGPKTSPQVVVRSGSTVLACAPIEKGKASVKVPPAQDISVAVAPKCQ